MRGHNFHPTILREFDICGIVGETLGEDDAWALGAAFGTQIRETGGASVVVGQDGRLSSPAIAAALCRGLTSTGLEVLTIGVCPIPMVYFADRHFDADGAVMVTGGHGPATHNGFKLMNHGVAICGEGIRNLAAIARRGAFATGSGHVLCRPVLDIYVDRLLGDSRMSRPLTVAWDAGNGAAGKALARLCRRLPGQHVLLNGTIDGRFPSHHPDPADPDNLVELKAVVQAENCDLGIAFDGDGGRIGVIDREGRILSGDQLLTLLAEEVLRDCPGATVIADVKASQVLFDAVARLGGHSVMARAGHSPIRAKMLETGAALAGEVSGHLFFADHYYGYDDALYAAVRLLNVASRAEGGIAALRDGLPETFVSPEVRIPCGERRKRQVIADIRGRVQELRADASMVDGVRVRSGDGWWLLRASNTHDALVARCEGVSPAALQRLRGVVADQLLLSDISRSDLSGLLVADEANVVYPSWRRV